MTRMAIAASCSLVGALAGCSVSAYTPPPVHSAQTGTQGLRQVHSPGRIADDMRLQPGRCHRRDAADGEPLPDAACTPGAVDPAVTQSTIRVTICAKGWTTTVRPPLAQTAPAKRASELAYGDPSSFTGEYDHVVPLELGGANSTSNLWPEPGLIPNSKDKVEGKLRASVCAGRLTLVQAQIEIAADWTVARW